VSPRRTSRRLRGEPRPQDGQGQAGQTGIGRALGEEIKQRAQVAQVGTTGVFGAAALQREVFVELLENGVHIFTVADDDALTQSTRRNASGVRSFSAG
jgi:hypothetical protein